MRVPILMTSLYSLVLILLVTGCTYVTQGLPEPDRDALLAGNSDHFGDRAETVVYPDQGWDASDSLWFYNTTQGSNLMDYEIFLKLEQADSSEPFRDNKNMQEYRYLTQRPGRDNPDGLPVGWVKDSYDGNDYVGFTCAACHTTQVNYKGHGIRIDGGPAMADMETMLEDLEVALSASLTGKKFETLARRVLASDASNPDTLQAFRDLLERDQRSITTYNAMNRSIHEVDGTPIRYGYARLDAFGRIYNRVMAHLVPDGSFQGNSANAPVSYPFLWDTPQHDFVQWNGIGDNGSALGLGPLGRNTGEVLGVFATFDVERDPPGWFARLLGFKSFSYQYPSSAESRNQVRLEDHLNDLWSPSWPELAERNILPPISATLANEGKKVFSEFKCNLCHEAIDRTSPDRRVIAQFASLDLIQTDPKMATNAIARCGDAGVIRDIDLGLCADHPDNSLLVPVLPALSEVTGGVMKQGLLRKIGTFYEAIKGNPLDGDPTQRHVDLEVANKGYLNAYKGRPLNGIWATAPYLHSGSVPNLYELFLPSTCGPGDLPGKDCRSKTFMVGMRELDTDNVGFRQPSDPSSYTEPPLFVFDTSLPGNSNRGHEYVVGVTPMPKLDSAGSVVRDDKGEVATETFPVISEEKRKALVEYLKTL